MGDGDFRVAATVPTMEPNSEDVQMAQAVTYSQQSDIPATQESAASSQFTFAGSEVMVDTVAEERYFDLSQVAPEDATDSNVTNGA